MGDRGEGDSGYLAHLGAPIGSAGRPDRREPPAAQQAPADDAAAAVARRLQARLDRHVWLLDRMQGDQLYAEPAGLAELQDTARRMRRDTESLLLLGGHEPGVRESGPRRLADVLADAAGAAEEPHRVEVRPGPSAFVAPVAAVEFRHVLAELVDHLTRVHPSARLELVSRLDGEFSGRGITVDAVVDGAHEDPEGLAGRRAAATSEQLARRSRSGIALRHPPAGAPAGLVVSVHCPPAVVTVEEPEAPRRPEPAEPAGAGLLNGSGLGTYGTGLSGGGPERTNGASHGASNGVSNGVSNGEPRPTLAFDEAPRYSPSQSSQVDELFGPLLDLPLEPIDDRYATPIFEAIASAWFREGDGEEGGADRPEGGRGPLDWETPQDDEWREAAARAARPEPSPTTASGLPRRNPGDQLVPPPRSTGQQGGGPPERVPDRVRDRLGSYQRGLREGRHRAGPEGADREDW